jgi:prepilin-type processing-associated H-X9-DG protein
VLDRFIGNWSFQATIKAEGNPKEKHQTGTISYTRVLGGRFVQERGEDSERNTTLLLYTYDEQRKCYCYWLFSSGPQSTEVPAIGKWDEAAHALNWTYPAAKGTTAQHRFISDDAIECSVLAKNDAGSTVFQAEYRLTRVKDAQNPSQPAVESSAPVLGQTAEQRVLDRLLGTWSQETIAFKAKWTPEEKHTTGTYSVTRILGGKFVRLAGEDLEKKSIMNLYTYDQQRQCYRAWSFGANYGGQDIPSDGRWNEATQCIDYYVRNDDGLTTTMRMHFANEDAVVISGVIKDSADEVLLNMEFRMTRLKGAADATKAQSVSAPSESHSDGEVRAMCQNNLKQLGLIFKMFANESKGQCYPQLSPEPGRLMFSHEKGEQTYPVYPDYLTDLNVLICPGDKKAEVLKTPEAKKDPGKLIDDHSYFYFGYVVHNDADVKAFADAYKARVAKGLKFNEDLDGPQGKIYQLREGIERKLVTDASNPAAAAKTQSEIPVLIERPGHHEPDGGNVLFMDGHVEFIRMGGNWPMTKETLDILKSLDEMKATKK